MSSITDLKKSLEQKECSSLSIIEACIKKSKQLSHLNAFIAEPDQQELLAQAQKADSEAASKEKPLLGIPIAVSYTHLTLPTTPYV